MARTTLYMLRVCVVSNIYQSSFDDGRFCQHKRYAAAPGAATSNQFYSGFANFMSTPTDRTTHSLTYAYIHKHTHTRARLRTLAPTTSIRISCFDASPQPNGWFCVRRGRILACPDRPTGITQQPATTECGQQQLQLLCASPQSTRAPGAVPTRHTRRLLIFRAPLLSIMIGEYVAFGVCVCARCRLGDETEHARVHMHVLCTYPHALHIRRQTIRTTSARRPTSTTLFCDTQTHRYIHACSCACTVLRNVCTYIRLGTTTIKCRPRQTQTHTHTHPFAAVLRP